MKKKQQLGSLSKAIITIITIHCSARYVLRLEFTARFRVKTNYLQYTTKGHLLGRLEIISSHYHLLYDTMIYDHMLMRIVGKRP